MLHVIRYLAIVRFMENLKKNIKRVIRQGDEAPLDYGRILGTIDRKFQGFYRKLDKKLTKTSLGSLCKKLKLFYDYIPTATKGIEPIKIFLL